MSFKSKETTFPSSREHWGAQAFSRRQSGARLPAGGLAEAAGGLAVICLAAAGLCNFQPLTLAAIAEIVFGGALLAALSGAFGVRIADHPIDAVGWGTSMATEVIGAVCGIVLGFLALLSIDPLTLSAVVVLIFGGVRIAGGLARNRVEMFANDGCAVNNPPLILSSAAVEMLVGIAVVILGILAIVAAYRAPATSLDLTLVGLLCLGVSALLSGLAFSSRTMRFTTR